MSWKKDSIFKDFINWNLVIFLKNDRKYLGSYGSENLGTHSFNRNYLISRIHAGLPEFETQVETLLYPH